jgi:hypothetical protein
MYVAGPKDGSKANTIVFLVDSKLLLANICQSSDGNSKTLASSPTITPKLASIATLIRWTGRYVILAAHGEADAAYACHPSLVAVLWDCDPVTKPLSLAVGDADSLLDNKTVGKIQDLMAKKTALPHDLRIYEDQIHGFALRSDWSSEKDRKAMDEAKKQGIDLFKNLS